MTLFFWLIAAGISGFVVLFLTILCLIGWVLNWRWLSCFAGLPALAMALGAGAVLSVVTWGILHSINPENVFQNTFEKNVGEMQVTDVKSSVFWFANEGIVYLRFHSSKDHFRELVPSRLQPVSPDVLQERLWNDHGSPEWWSPKVASNWKCYYRAYAHFDDVEAQEKHVKQFASEQEYMAFDPTTGTAYYCYLGID